MPKVRIAVLLLVVALLPRLGFAQSPVLVDIAPCMAQATDTARLACYDRLEAEVYAAQSASAAPAAAVKDAPAVAATPEAPAARANTQENAQSQEALATFGRETPAQVVRDERGQNELLDRIVSMREREPGRWLFTLASGQRWYQTNSARILLREGMDVRIYPSPLGGSYRMTARSDSRGFVQVRRVE